MFVVAFKRCPIRMLPSVVRDRVGRSLMSCPNLLFGTDLWAIALKLPALPDLQGNHK